MAQTHRYRLRIHQVLSRQMSPSMHGSNSIHSIALGPVNPGCNIWYSRETREQVILKVMLYLSCAAMVRIDCFLCFHPAPGSLPPQFRPRLCRPDDSITLPEHTTEPPPRSTSMAL